MRFFNRQSQPAEVNTTNAVGKEKPGRNSILSHKERRSHGKSRRTYNDASLDRRPTVGQWFKMTWLDILTMIVMGAIGLGVYMAPPAPSRSFPVYDPNGEIVYPEFAYRLRKEIVPIWAAALLAASIPIVTILFMQIRIRSFWDVNNGIIGLLYSLITAAVFQVFLKWLIGGLRPHFLAVCKPAVPLTGAQTGNGLNGIMYDRTVCTGDKDEIDDSLESFPSGHTTAAFAGFVYLYLYLNAKLKVWSNYHPAYWKLIVTYIPILGAVLIGGALTIDEFHNWYDVIAGAIIGTTMAFSSYRMVYASVWDFRFNHIPLVRDVPFTFGNGLAAFDGFRDAMWTRKAGWGSMEGGAWGGAPFDASHAQRGSGGVMTDGAANGRRSGSHGRHSISRKPVGSSPRHGRADDMV